MLLRVIWLVVFTTFFTGCASLPKEIKHPTEPKPHKLNSTLNDLINTYYASQPTQPQESSAVLVQNTGWDALAQRLALIEAAEYSINMQYYIWHSDSSGRYLASRLIAAADRGVKVRLLLDDINLNERENLLAALDTHPNIEIRIFNPTPSRRGLAKWLSFLSDFSRFNHRMHNKSFTVDDVLSIVGGRNIGDEYFDLSNEINFRDRDVLTMGKVVSEIQTSFGNYWNSRWSYPINLLADNIKQQHWLQNKTSAPDFKHYPALPEGRLNAHHFLQTTLGKMTWVQAHFISDRPVPLDIADTSEPMATAQLLGQLAKQSQQEISLESAYLIFDDRQLAGLKALVDKGITIKALTNSMASNDLATNHSGYAARRKGMLENGLKLFELKPDTGLCVKSTKYLSKCAPNIAYGLHAKSIVFDKKIAVIGSFNFNLRSTYLNTESILIIENQKIAHNLAKDIEQAMNDNNSWRLQLHKDEVRWYSGEQYWENEPETDRWQRSKSRLLQLLPIEKYL